MMTLSISRICSSCRIQGLALEGFHNSIQKLTVANFGEEAKEYNQWAVRELLSLRRRRGK